MAEDAARETAALLALLDAPTARRSKVIRAVLEGESALALLEEESGGALPIGPDPVEERIREAEEQIAAWSDQGISVISVFDHRYPAQLRSVVQMPPVIYCRGALQVDRRAIAVVGSREAGPAQLELAGNIARVLTRHDVTVVSGLAKGIDAAALTAALDEGGRTVAVIASGPDVIYPPQNARLHETIAATGLVLSTYKPGTPVESSQFLARNAVMSGYAAATVVVEAAYRSGSRAQARMALEHGRPVVFPQELLRHDWAQDYAKRPGVYVAASAAELLDIVERIIAALDLTPEELSQEHVIAW